MGRLRLRLYIPGKIWYDIGNKGRNMEKQIKAQKEMQIYLNREFVQDGTMFFEIFGQD